MKRSHGGMSTQTKKLKGKGMVTPLKLIREFAVDSQVTIAPKALRAGQPPLRYSGKHGRIIERRGRSYVVAIYDGNKRKLLICDPAHLEDTSSRGRFQGTRNLEIPKLG